MTVTITISAQFTDVNGSPATGLTLADIDITLAAIAKSGGGETLVWNTQNPTREVTNIGMYQRDLTTADLEANTYHAMAEYTGASVLDSNFVFGSVGEILTDDNGRVDVGNWLGSAVTLSAGNLPDVNVSEISDDATAADNLELDYDGTGFAKANSTIGTTTTNTDMRGTDSAALASVATETRLAELDAANIPADLTNIEADTQNIQSRLPAALVSGAMDSDVSAIQNNAITAAAIATDAIDADALAADAVTEIQSGLGTSANQTTILARIGSFTTGGVNDILGFFKALLKSDASTPSDVGGTFDPSTDSTQAIRDTAPLGTAMRGTDSAALASVVGALTDAAAAGDPTVSDTIIQYVKQLINILVGTDGVTTFPASAAPGNAISLAEVIRAIYDDSNELQTDWVNAGRLDVILDARASQTTVDAIETDTQDIQSRLPAALVSGNIIADIKAIDGNTTSAANLQKSTLTIVTGAAAAGTLSTTQMTTDLGQATDNHFIGRTIVWTSGVLFQQAALVTDYAGSGGLLTFTAVTEAPSATDTFVIV